MDYAAFSDKVKSKMLKDNSLNEEISFKHRLFIFFANILQKKKINVLLTSIFLVIETVQIISYAFTHPLIDVWNFAENTADTIHKVIGAARITTLYHELTFNKYLAIYIVTICAIFLYLISFIAILQIKNHKLKIYNYYIMTMRYFIYYIPIVLFIPIGDTMMIILHCNNNNTLSVFPNDDIKCYSGMHFLYMCLSIIFFIIFIFFVFLYEIFIFTPFQSNKEISKIDTTAEIYNLIFKTILMIQCCFRLNEHLIIIIILFFCIVVTIISYENHIYNSYILNTLVNFRNLSVLWTFISLLLTKVVKCGIFTNGIYFNAIGYPLMIFISIFISRPNILIEIGSLSKINDEVDFLIKIRSLNEIISNVLCTSKQNPLRTKSDIILKGYISIHESTCINEDCPLKAYEETTSESTRRSCLLNYMNLLYGEGIKKFYNSRMIMIDFIYFNFKNKYNLQLAKIILGKVESIPKTISEEFILYDIKRQLNIRLDEIPYELREENSEDSQMKVVDIDEKFKRLKVLIEETAKLFSDFWENLATNLTINLNLSKIFLLGQKLNANIDELKMLWEKDLKNQKIDFDNQQTIQLYALFLKKVLRNKAEAEEITKKLNDEQYFDFSKKLDESNITSENIDKYLENQDYLVFCNSNDKGECDIIQCSNNFVLLTGYQKTEIIGRRIEFLMPSLFTENDMHMKMLSEKLKSSKSSLLNNKGILNSKQCVFAFLKLKNGFVLPVDIRVSFYLENDFKNSFLIKTKFELKDVKTQYSMYLLTRDDFTLENISSSAVHLGLSKEMITKNVLDMNFLIRNGNFKPINFFSCYHEYLDEFKTVTWIYPDSIYTGLSTTGSNFEALIASSKQKIFNLMIFPIHFRNNILGYCFKLVDTKNTKKDYVDIPEFEYNEKYSILYNMKGFNYIRTKLIEEGEETQLVPSLLKLKTERPSVQYSMSGIQNKLGNKKSSSMFLSSIDSENEEQKEKGKQIELSKELINKLQAKTSVEIKELILGLPFYGQGVTLEKFRPNKEKYQASHCTEPELKISVISFIQRIEDKRNNHITSKPIELMANSKKIELSFSKASNNSRNSSKSGNVNSPSHSKNSETNEMNNILDKYINKSSTKYISLFSFILFLITFIFLISEFVLSYKYIHQYIAKINNAESSCKVINGLMYTKYFITEAVLAQDPSYTNINGTGSNVEYIYDMMLEMSMYRSVILDNYNLLRKVMIKKNRVLDEYMRVPSLSIKTMNNENKGEEDIELHKSMERLVTNIFYVSTINDNYYQINMSNRNAYELMKNLLNDYVLVWKDIVNGFFNEIDNLKENQESLLIIIIVFIISQIIMLIILFKLLTKYQTDKEKPLDLFLTIKKQKFEQLKEASESFVNRLLNKILGNDDIEQETTSQTSIAPTENDIVINKLKNKNSYKKSSNLMNSNYFAFIGLVCFIVLITIYLIGSFFAFHIIATNLNYHAYLLNITLDNEFDAIEKINILKSYLFDSSIQILNQTDTKSLFENKMKNLTFGFGNLLQETYSHKCFDSYEQFFFEHMTYTISSILPESPNQKEQLIPLIERGFKGVYIHYIELIRSLWLLPPFFTPSQLLYTTEFGIMNEILRNVIRPWFNVIKDKLLDEYKHYIEWVKLIMISLELIICVILIFVYLVLWRRYENKIIESLNTSVQLLNLLPNELKAQIIKHISTEEEDNHNM